MSLANEAGYLYVLSKELTAINKMLEKYSKHAQHHIRKHNLSKTEKDKARHRHKHDKVKGNIVKLMKKHDRILKLLNHHNVAFYHALKKEHSL
jgi:hypothetical protein